MLSVQLRRAVLALAGIFSLMGASMQPLEHVHHAGDTNVITHRHADTDHAVDGGHADSIGEHAAALFLVPVFDITPASRIAQPIVAIAEHADINHDRQVVHIPVMRAVRLTHGPPQPIRSLRSPPTPRA